MANGANIRVHPADEQAFPDELVIAFVYAVGTQIDPIERHLTTDLEAAGYSVESIRISELFEEHVAVAQTKLVDDPYDEMISNRMDVGNALRKATGRHDIAARLAIASIHQTRPATNHQVKPRTAYVIRSVKRKEEVALLRDVYGAGFFLVGVYAPEQERLLYLQTQRAVRVDKARALIERDRNEDDRVAEGQQTSKTFALADVFVSQDPNSYRERLSRFVDLIFGDPFHTPSQDEHCMFMAYSAALRSGDLSRQVGAALVSANGDMLSVGCNDVPRFGGGLYWPGPVDQRDHVRGSDSNEKRRDEIIREILECLRNDAPTSITGARAVLEELLDGYPDELETVRRDDDVVRKLAGHVRNRAAIGLDDAKHLLRDTPLFSLTEFGRTVHAEMDAILACARTGRSPAGGTLYTTTFPCHNCTRHIVAAGIHRVIYVEPYPKSLAFRLHFDSIVLNEHGLDHGSRMDCRDKVAFEPFLGIGPRRFFDLFSLSLGSGRPLRRKKEMAQGETVDWQRRGNRPRVPLEATSYIDREQNVAVSVNRLLREDKDSH